MSTRGPILDGFNSRGSRGGNCAPPIDWVIAGQIFVDSPTDETEHVRPPPQTGLQQHLLLNRFSTQRE